MKLYVKNTSGDTYVCEVDSHTTIGEIASDFLEAMGWSLKDSSGRDQRAVAEYYDPTTQKYERLRPDTIAADIREHSMLAIYPEAIAGCFTADTLVAIDIDKHIAISKITRGDKISSGRIDLPGSRLTSVVDIHRNTSDNVIKINGKLNVTSNHLICCNHEWKKAREIKVGDLLQTVDNCLVPVETIENLNGIHEVYNLHVDGVEHSFFADGFLVHNMDYDVAVAKTMLLEKSKRTEGSYEEKINALEKRVNVLESKLNVLISGFDNLEKHVGKIVFNPITDKQVSKAVNTYTILTLDDAFSRFDGGYQFGLILGLSQLLNIQFNDIKLIDAQSGSIKMTLEMPVDAALKLLEIWLQQRLTIEGLPISKVELEPIGLPQFNTLQITSRPNEIRILFLASNPDNTSHLRLGEEVRSIDSALRQSEYRDRFKLIQCWATKLDDIASDLLRHQPQIVHFSGHGNKKGELIFENNSGLSDFTSISALSKMLSGLKDNIRCIVLNACYSERQANSIAETIECVIGMSKSIGDRSAIIFASSFYEALAYGKDVLTAFKLGCSKIDLKNLSDFDIPVIKSPNGDPSSIKFV